MSLFREKTYHNEVLKFIKVLRNYPCLWNAESIDFRNNLARQEAVEEIGKRMNITGEDVRRKINSLRAQYNRELVRMKKLKVQIPRWRYFNALRFWRPGSEAARSKNSLNTSENTTKNNSNHEINAESESNMSTASFEERIEETSSVAQVHSDYEDNDYDAMEYASRMGLGHTSRPKNVVVIRKESVEQDEYDTFGENVANELRLLENQKKFQQMLKCRILQAILEVNEVRENCLT